MCGQSPGYVCVGQILVGPIEGADYQTEEEALLGLTKEYGEVYDPESFRFDKDEVFHGGVPMSGRAFAEKYLTPEEIADPRYNNVTGIRVYATLKQP